jgi:hypothetical protein
MRINPFGFEFKRVLPAFFKDQIINALSGRFKTGSETERSEADFCDRARTEAGLGNGC